MTKELNLEELQLAFFEKVQELYEDCENFSWESLIDTFDDALTELDLELEEDAWSDTYDAVKDHWKNPFYVHPIDECMEQLDVDPTPEQHAVATDCVSYLNSMLESGCFVGSTVLSDYLEENHADEVAELIAQLVII